MMNLIISKTQDVFGDLAATLQSTVSHCSSHHQASHLQPPYMQTMLSPPIYLLRQWS